jgi:hypothetical protein
MTNYAEFPWLSLFSKAMIERAYGASNGELTRSKNDALSVITTLVANSVTILGIDIWIPTHPGPIIPTPFVHDWNMRYPISALAFIETFDWDPTDRSHGGMAPWFNITA